jgi:hypothetical protein
MRATELVGGNVGLLDPSLEPLITDPKTSSAVQIL